MFIHCCHAGDSDSHLRVIILGEFNTLKYVLIESSKKAPFLLFGDTRGMLVCWRCKHRDQVPYVD